MAATRTAQWRRYFMARAGTYLPLDYDEPEELVAFRQGFNIAFDDGTSFISVSWLTLALLFRHSLLSSSSLYKKSIISAPWGLSGMHGRMNNLFSRSKLLPV
jgi:hypothetical protein